ncbi:MAG: hypothetical protein JNL97_14940 [Verrucomicrobiales bacterium]|nr:hypothetical protein [Verrucomicrobiales bacterium]
MNRQWTTTEEDLACDEALLDACEAGEPGTEKGVLRFYAATSPSVVVGYGNRIATEVNVSACDAAGVPILRRSSGGGTVVLGPGCLAYALVLPIDAAPSLASVTGTNRWIMERHRSALETACGRAVSVRGHTDLTLGELKFSGNAQRRRQRAVLFHGTLLLAMDLERVATWLPLPSVEPDYRRGRGHAAFLINFPVSEPRVREIFCEAWEVTESWDPDSGLDDRVTYWMRDRYGDVRWHRRF